MFGINLVNIEVSLSNLKDFFRWWKKKNYDKSNIRILFIDDEYKDFPVIQNLKEAGWSVSAVKDVHNIDDDSIKCAQIIFVDYKGVGKTLSESEHGIGIIKLIKKIYGNNKRVILYSGHNRFSLGDNIDAADNKLLKSADTREFIEMVQGEIKKLK